MKKILTLLIVLAFTVNIQAEEVYCKVQICNRIERISLDIWSHINDRIGENCVNAIIEKKDAVVGKILSEESRWYQGSQINPTKKSVSRVKQVYSCTDK